MQDLILKLLSGDYPLHQAMVLRGLTALPLLYLMVRMNCDGARLFAPGWTAAAARGWSASWPIPLTTSRWWHCRWPIPSRFISRPR
ncbi:hypothetical protein ACFSHQ_14310 [Gemmobacter lanyuensis]